MKKELYYYKVKILHVYDGDTITSFEIDFGFGHYQLVKRGDRRSIRLKGINADKVSTEIGKKAKEFLKQFEGKEVIVKSYKSESCKYGRYLFEIFAEYEGEIQNINQVMLQKGLVKNYNNE